MIVFVESVEKSVLKEAGGGNALICRKGIVGTTTVSEHGYNLGTPNGFEWVLANLSCRQVLVKSNEIPQYTYICKDGGRALNLEKVTFNASAMRFLGVRFS